MAEKPRIITPFDKDYVSQLKPIKQAVHGGKGWSTQQGLRLSRENRILQNPHGGAYTRAKK